jgi:two-component system chemotaxis response regulator CheB
MKILVVDDSIVFRSQITASLSGIKNVEVVGSASNGRIALQKLEQSEIDLITLDMEMPELNGLETLSEIRARGLKTKVIVFSSQTIKGAEKALQALSAGADDVVAKPQGDALNFESVQDMIRIALVPRVLQFLQKTDFNSDTVIVPGPVKASSISGAKNKLKSFLPNAIVIASSTGGPSALEEIFTGISGPFKRPLLIVQHMPPVFTQILAKRLASLTGADFVEAKDGDPVVAGRAYVAPGDYHMKVEIRNGSPAVSLTHEPLRNSVRPAADFLFETASSLWKDSLLGIVLTGMGEDGAVGSRAIRTLGGRILLQNKDSCVVFGMPGAVFNNGDYDEIGDLEFIRNLLKGVLI